MNVQHIAERIRHPESITSDELNDFRELSEKYPYSQIFSLLYLKGLGKFGDVRFEDELLKHSYRIGDRVQLYHLIHDQESKSSSEPAQTIVESAPETVEPVAEKVIAPETIEQEEPVEEPITEAPEVVEEMTTSEEVKEEVPTEETEILPEINETPEEVSAEIPEQVSELSDASPETEVEDATEESATTIETVETDPLEKSILQHALSANYQLEELTEEELRHMEERQEEKTTVTPSEPTIPQVDIDARQTFSSWLSANKNDHPQGKEDQEAIRALVNDFSEFDPTERLFGEVEKPKKEFFSPIKKAKESLREEGLPVSETLAKIYAMQGNYPKAIEAYEQLSLNYPEKKIFFANLIADLKKKINIK